MKRIKNTNAIIILTDAQVKSLYAFGTGQDDEDWAKPGVKVVVTHRSQYWPIVQARQVSDYSDTPKSGLFWTKQLDGDGF